MNDPIDRITWLKAEDLQANAWNPNIVFDAEFRLLERSILTIGWVQPVLVSRAGTIIDGYHRWRLSIDSAPIRKKYGGLLPCAVLEVGEDEAMVLTVRMNRAKGSHVAVKMSVLVRRLIDGFGWDAQQIAAEIGANRDEVELLYSESIFTSRRIDKWRYSKSWVPEDRP